MIPVLSSILYIEHQSSKPFRTFWASVYRLSTFWHWSEHTLSIFTEWHCELYMPGDISKKERVIKTKWSINNFVARFLDVREKRPLSPWGQSGVQQKLNDLTFRALTTIVFTSDVKLNSSVPFYVGPDKLLVSRIILSWTHQHNYAIRAHATVTLDFTVFNLRLQRNFARKNVWTQMYCTC